MNEELFKKVKEVVPDEILQATLQALMNKWGSIIHVDRTVLRPIYYPSLTKEVKYPRLELTGPTEYDIRTLRQWLHPKQEHNIVVTGNEIFNTLIAEKLLEGCLGLADLRAIQAKGIGFFRKYFSEKVPFGWKSVVLDRHDDLFVPCLYDCGTSLDLLWIWLDGDWRSNNPALMYHTKF